MILLHGRRKTLQCPLLFARRTFLARFGLAGFRGAGLFAFAHRAIVAWTALTDVTVTRTLLTRLAVVVAGHGLIGIGRPIALLRVVRARDQRPVVRLLGGATGDRLRTVVFRGGVLLLARPAFRPAVVAALTRFTRVTSFASFASFA